MEIIRSWYDLVVCIMTMFISLRALLVLDILRESKTINDLKFLYSPFMNCLCSRNIAHDETCVTLERIFSSLLSYQKWHCLGFVTFLSYVVVFLYIFLYKETNLKHISSIYLSSVKIMHETQTRKLLMGCFETAHMTKCFIWQTFNASWKMILKIGTLGPM